MRRSELVRKVADMIAVYSQNSTWNCEPLARDIVKMLEKEGMKPPKIYVVDGFTLDVSEQYIWEKEECGAVKL